MKIKNTATVLCLIFAQIFFAQEDNTKKVTDSINAITLKNIEAQKTILESQKETQETLNAKKEAEDRKKEIEKRQKEIEKQQEKVEKEKEKVEKENAKVEKEQKKQEKEKEKIDDAKNDLAKAKEKLIDHQNDLLKTAEKHNKKLAKGKLTLNDIADFEKSQIKQNLKTEKLKENITKAEKKLSKLTN